MKRINTISQRIMFRKKLFAILIMIVFVASMIPTPAVAAQKTSKSKCKTYVFFGSDSRRPDDLWKSNRGKKITGDTTGTQGIPRSDVIMLLRVDDRKKTIDVTSVYRDTLLDVSGKGIDFQKINKAYSDLGPQKAVKVIEKNLNIKVDGYVATNFKGVANVINAMGGVTIVIEKDKLQKAHQKNGFTTVPHAMNMYIDEMNRIYNLDVSHIKKTGKQKINGIQAVAYSRVRYTDGGDFRRTHRQRTVLTAMSSKYKRIKNPIKKAKVLNAVLNNIDTNIKLGTAKTLFKRTAKYKIVTRNGFPYYKNSKLIKTKKERGGVSDCIVPCDLRTNVIRLHKHVYKQSNYRASKTVKSYSRKIVNKTGFNYKNRVKSWDNYY